MKCEFESVPQPDGLTDQSSFVLLLPLLLMDAEMVPELMPSTTVVDAGGAIVTAIGRIVRVVLALAAGSASAVAVIVTEFALPQAEGVGAGRV